jgi:predicted unusual protein kinase regulating ubiquinone biosynthesis (AarF/ABC1/UbiB family)
MIYAFMPYLDPHPGNLLFMNDGGLGLIDFGCVQRYGPEEREIMLLADRMAFEDRSLAPEVVWRVCGVSEGDRAFPDYLRLMLESRDWMMEPFNRPGPFDFGDEAHFRRGMESFSRAVSKRTTRSHPMYVYWNRSVFGIKAILFRLRAQVDVQEIIRRERPRHD